MQRLFFIHVPKTAGTSFREMLRAARPSLRCYPGRWRLRLGGGRYPDPGAFVAAVQRARHQVYFGHHPYALCQSLGVDIECGVMLRNPVDRALSNLLHLKRHSPRMRDLSLQQLLSRRSVVQHHLRNLQTRFLQDMEASELDRFRRSKSPPRVDVDSALANLERCALVGLTERFEDSIRLAERVLGVRLPETRRLNRNASPREVPAWVLERLEEMNQADLALYHAAEGLVQRRLAELAGAPSHQDIEQRGKA